MRNIHRPIRLMDVTELIIKKAVLYIRKLSLTFILFGQALYNSSFCL